MNTKALHEKALQLAETYLNTESELIGVLVAMFKANSFVELRYLHLFDYLTKALGFSESQAGYFYRVTRKSVQVPELQQAIEQGELSVSQARRVERVITPENVKEWVGKAKELKQKDLEREVAKADPKGPICSKLKPVAEDLYELRVGISKAAHDELERLREIHGKDLKAMLEKIIQVAAEKLDPEVKAQKASSSRNPKAPPAPGRKAVPQHVRKQVIRRDGYQCKKCGSKRYMNLHHVRHVAEGGDNTAENLEFLCWYHHRQEHEQMRRRYGVASRRAVHHQWAK